jgi:predicted nucleic acid-binding protein
MKEAVVTLIDTSSWIEALRKSGDEAVRERVRLLLVNGTAAWCDMIRLELWNGASGHAETEMLSRMERDLPCLEITTEVWQDACSLARQARAAGISVPSTDILIVACARCHKASIEHVDHHFDLVSQLA